MISRGVLVPFRDEVIPLSRSPSQWPPTSIGCSRSATAPRRAGPACQPFGWLLVITRISEPTEIRVSTEIMKKIFPKFNLNSKNRYLKYTCHVLFHDESKESEKLSMLGSPHFGDGNIWQ